MNKILLQCDNLSKRYQEGTVQTDVLHNGSFSVGEGEMMAIVGSSGSGKSTLLHLLGGLDTPTNGDVIFSGQPMSKMSSAAKAELRNRELGFIYQFHHLLPDFTALENVAMPLLIGKKKPAEINARASDMLKAVGLGHRGNHRPSELSGGERAKLVLAKLMAADLSLKAFPVGHGTTLFAGHVAAHAGAFASDVGAQHGVGQHPAARDRTLGVLRGRRRRILRGERRRYHADDARQRNHAPESGEAISTSGAHDHMAPSMPMGRSK